MFPRFTLAVAIEAAEVPENGVPIDSYRPGIPVHQSGWPWQCSRDMDCLLDCPIAFFPRAEAFLCLVIRASMAPVNRPAALHVPCVADSGRCYFMGRDAGLARVGPQRHPDRHRGQPPPKNSSMISAPVVITRRNSRQYNTSVVRVVACPASRAISSMLTRSR